MPLTIDFTDLSYDPKWYDLSEFVQLKIRPYPLSMASIQIKDGDFVFSQAEQCKIFKHALVGWAGVVGADGLQLPCSDEVKQKIFDFGLGGGLVAFVMEKVREFREALDKTEKNS